MQYRNWSLKKKLTTLWIVLGLLFCGWIVLAYQAQGVDNTFLQSGKGISVDDNNDYISFTPESKYKTCLIFYPGALVDPVAYVPLCHSISDRGVQVFLIKMPWRLASYGYNKPKELDLFTDTGKSYVLAGHSQGAKMAAKFALENPGLIDKLILLGSSHPRDFSLADMNIPVLKIYGSKDGVADEKSTLKNKSKLPPATKYVRIDGANHSQFGYYGFQLGDNKAGISREEQQAILLSEMLKFIEKGSK
jgi:hypothetical protein